MCLPKFQNHENVQYHPFLLVIILTTKWEMYLFWKSIFGISESKTHQNYEVVELLHYIPLLSSFRCVTSKWRVTVMWLLLIGIAVQTKYKYTLNIYFKTEEQSTHIGRFRTIWKDDNIFPNVWSISLILQVILVWSFNLNMIAPGFVLFIARPFLVDFQFRYFYLFNFFIVCW